MQHRKHSRQHRCENGAPEEIRVAHPEDVPEQQVLDPRRRLRRQCEHDTEAEERRDDHGNGAVSRDEWQAPGNGDRDRGHQQADGAAQEQRRAYQRRHDETGEQAMREGLGRIREAVEDQPATEEAAAPCEQQALQPGAAHDGLGPRVGEEVQRRDQWWCGGSTAWLPSGSCTRSPP